VDVREKTKETNFSHIFRLFNSVADALVKNEMKGSVFSKNYSVYVAKAQRILDIYRPEVMLDLDL